MNGAMLRGKLKGMVYEETAGKRDGPRGPPNLAEILEHLQGS